MNNRIKLFRKAVRSLTESSARKLYTDHIYPYPHHYFSKKFPSQLCYRETWNPPPWRKAEDIATYIAMRIFWAGFWYQLFWHPEVILGHHTFPEPCIWTDEELGIPPDDVGPYKQWLANKMKRDAN